MKNTNILERISNFDKSDWNHVWWLLKIMINQFIMGNFHESREAYYWIKIHLSYDNKRLS